MAAGRTRTNSRKVTYLIEGAARGGMAPPPIPASGFLVAHAARCSSCRVCEMVCSLTHEGRVVPALARLAIRHDVFADDHPEVHVCPQCTGPECLIACPRGAISADPGTGARVVDLELCDGCGVCAEACHLDMIGVDPSSRKAFKCDLCDGEPLCVAYCAQKVLSYKPRKAP